MALGPKKTKYRKQMRGKMKGNATSGSTLSFGDFGIQSLDSGWITGKQIEAARVAISRSVKKGGRVWVRIFPDKPYTKKPTEVRMGKGKGPIEEYVAPVKPGRILYEMEGVTYEIAHEALTTASSKLPIKTKFVAREGIHHA
ncbi:MAG: 50S ribosomal protein L16 [Proteobacteria bacterium]|nr:50S ribosomal protein L16 [Pseudomonadota bacterium]